MKLTENFNLNEFISPDTFAKWGRKAIWFLDERTYQLAQAYKVVFLNYYKEKYGDRVVDVAIVINDWSFGGSKIGRGYREPKQYVSGQFKKNPLSESMHRQGKAFDCDIIVIFDDGSREEANYSEICKYIMDNQEMFYDLGLRRIESPKFATTWLHSDVANTGPLMVGKILMVEP